VIAAVLLAAILASDKLEELLPALAPIIRRLTETAAPMLLGGILLGVGVVYQTLPWGCGGGIALLALGAVLLIAGSIVGLFFPAGQRRD
jgi:peptidoglycan/LPS O-acetylase OafA/YrhL